MLTILAGDAIDQLRTLPDESVQCCVTSPPYWGLRDYGTAEWEGGDTACDHKRPPMGGHGEKSLIGKGERDIEIMSNQQFAHECRKCGAKRVDSQLGLEKTPDEYVAKMVEVFREVRRVLRKDGTLWMNLGDTYNANTGAGFNGNAKRPECARETKMQQPYGLPAKNLIGIPWRVAFALQADGWWLRSDIIWAKPNPMPESVTDRPTKAHEYLFLLTKSANYFYDAEAIKERQAEISVRRAFSNNNVEERKDANGDVYAISGRSQNATYERMRESIWNGESQLRNKRSVWTVATAPYPEAHFATYPPDLIKPCIMAGSRVGDTVLDPFAGSGTTGMVAMELGRKVVLIELNPKYVELIRQRCDITPGLQLA